MRVIMLRFVMVAAALQLSVLASACGMTTPLSLHLDSPQEGEALDSNVVQVAGKVNKTASSVTVDNVTATVLPDGSFSAYVEVPSGNSTIRAVAKLGTMVSEVTRSVSFDPPLVVFLFIGPKLEPGVDYRKAPLTFTGRVNKPEAAVKVNGAAVVVAADGTFSAQVRMGLGNNKIEAVATLGDESDTESWTYLLESEQQGVPVLAPGQNLQDISTFLFTQSSVQLNAGESDSIAITYRGGKELFNPWTFEQSVSLVPKQYDENQIAFPEGLAVSLEPPEFLVYPKVSYHEAITVITSRTLRPGEYTLFLQGFYQGKRTDSAWINLQIDPPRH